MMRVIPSVGSKEISANIRTNSAAFLSLFRGSFACFEGIDFDSLGAASSSMITMNCFADREVRRRRQVERIGVA